MALHESFLNHRDNRWFKLATVLVLICCGVYAWHDPVAGPNGGTWLGYTLGTIGALLIVWLALLGARKRSYSSNMGTVKGWTSAHVWLGIALIIIGTLHSGFQFGWNIHTLAWVLMMLVIISGMWGVIAYLRYPDRITAAHKNLTAEEMVEEIAELDKQLLALASKLGRETHERTLQSINRTQIGGPFWKQVLGIKAKQAPADGLISRLREELNKPAFSQAPEMQAKTGGEGQHATMMFMAEAFVSAEQDAREREERRKLVEVLSRKKAMVTSLNDDITRRARMAVWLYFHVPLTIALLASLIAHILSVFLYW